MSKTEEFNTLVGHSRRAVLLTHVHPDGDALGSQFAIWHWLNGKVASIVAVHEDVPRNLDFICGRIPFVNPTEATPYIGEADLIICTDFNTVSRSGVDEGAFRSSKAKKVLFDHHLNPEAEDFDLIFGRTDISSACEVVYDVLKSLCKDGDISVLPLECRNALLTGMTTDTNNFSNSVFPGTFAMASDLISSGVDREAILDLLYNHESENKVKAFSWILYNRLVIREDGLACIVVDEEVWHKFSLQKGELEGLVNIPLMIGRVKACVRLLQDPDNPKTFRVSIRSKRGYSANALAVKYFHGGGHLLASGGKLTVGEDVPDVESIAPFLEKIELS